jgi:2-polyprenyl-6-methoxyphenol hydroxylase-like FAD-dependent oxidoreductase
VISVHRWVGSRVFSIVRQTVINALAAAATRSGAEIVTGSVATAASADGELVLADGQRLRADLIVAADGSNSALRDGLGLLSTRKYLVDGSTRLLIAKTAEERLHADGATTVEYWSGSRRVLYTPCSETDVYIALTMLDSDALAKATPVRKDAWRAWFPHLEPLIERGPLRSLRPDQAQPLVGWKGGGDRRRRPCAAAEHRPGRRMRHDERAVAGGLSRP